MMYRSLGALLLMLSACVPPTDPSTLPLAESVLAWEAPVYWRSAGVDQALGVASLDDDSLVVVGRTEGGLGDADGFVSRVDQNGQVLWTKILGSAGVDLFLDVAVHTSGLVVAVGVSTGDFEGETIEMFSDGAVSALSETGEVMWSRLLGLGAINQVQVVEDGILVSGSGMQPGRLDADAFVTRMSLDGEIQWVRWFGEEGMEAATGIAARDGHIGVVGFRDDGMAAVPGAGTLDGWVAILREDGMPEGGDRVWDLGGNESLTRVCIQADGSLIAAGYTDIHGDIDAIVVAFDEEKREVTRWVSQWNGDDAAYGLLCDDGGNLYVSGRLDEGDRSDAFWARLSANLSERQKETEDFPGRDEWVDLAFWHDHVCAVGYRKKTESPDDNDVDAILDCMPQGAAQ